MKTILQKIGLMAFASILGTAAWSQCPTVNCPSDTILYADMNGCGASFTYTAPEGTDACDATVLTFNYTGVVETWVVPAGVTNISIEANGAEGSYNTSSGTSPGLGATMTGDFVVTPGETISILVGQQYHDTGGNGGGGGSFVVDALNTPLVIAGGGGGSSDSQDSPAKHGQITTTGGTGAGGGGIGGTAGNGGSIGATFASGAGGGLLTDGADGWTGGSGGDAFVNGGAGANVGYGIGGFGGGGNGSGYSVGGGGGGYSGGGAGSNSTGGGVGGGGGSINNGTNQNNIAGNNSGHGSVIISYGGMTTTTFESGIGSGGTFPIGTTVETFSVVNAYNDSAWCSFNVTVVDTIIPTLTTPSDLASCDDVIWGASTTTADNCIGETLSYNLTGATTGSGSGEVNGLTFNVGTTTVWYIATDASGNQDSVSFNVEIYPTPVVTMDDFTVGTVCINSAITTLPNATPAGGTYSGSGVSGVYFEPATAGNGSHWITYSYTDGMGCSSADSSEIIVDPCLNIEELSFVGFNVYPNPSTGLFSLEFQNTEAEQVEITISDLNGKAVYSGTSHEEAVKIAVDLSSEAPGVYMMKITSDKHTTVQRIVKK